MCGAEGKGWGGKCKVQEVRGIQPCLYIMRIPSRTLCCHSTLLPTSDLTYVTRLNT